MRFWKLFGKILSVAWSGCKTEVLLLLVSPRFYEVNICAARGRAKSSTWANAVLSLRAGMGDSVVELCCLPKGEMLLILVKRSFYGGPPVLLGLHFFSLFLFSWLDLKAQAASIRLDDAPPPIPSLGPRSRYVASSPNDPMLVWELVEFGFSGVSTFGRQSVSFSPFFLFLSLRPLPKR